jgi:hypothetical protein
MSKTQLIGHFIGDAFSIWSYKFSMLLKEKMLCSIVISVDLKLKSGLSLTRCKK